MKVESIIFHGKAIPCFQNEQGEVFFAVKPICQAIGLDHKAQKERIKVDEVLGEVGGTYPLPSGRGEQETFCIPLKYLSGWLFSIPMNLVKPEAREILLAYKRECYDVLHNHFFNETQAAPPKQIETPYVPDIWEKRLNSIYMLSRTYVRYGEAMELIEKGHGASPGEYAMLKSQRETIERKLRDLFVLLRDWLPENPTW
jgi:hypothetical protein